MTAKACRHGEFLSVLQLVTAGRWGWFPAGLCLCWGIHAEHTQVSQVQWVLCALSTSVTGSEGLAGAGSCLSDLGQWLVLWMSVKSSMANQSCLSLCSCLGSWEGWFLEECCGLAGIWASNGAGQDQG